jgi:hypothetical protein
MRTTQNLIFGLALISALCGLSRAATTPILPGQIVAGSITGTGQTTTYSFTASSNDVVTIGLVRTNGSGVPHFYLFDPEGTLVSEQGSATVLHTRELRLNQTGEYTLLLFAAGFSGDFDYFITFSRVACQINLRELGDDAEGLIYGRISRGQITGVDMDTYCFNANSNDVVSIGLVRTNGTGIPHFYLFDPEGNYVTEQGSATVLHILDQRLNQTGAYTLLVLADNFSDSYDYLLTVTHLGCGTNLREPGDDPESLVPGQIGHGKIAFVDTDTYCFTANANDVVSIGLVRTNGTGIPRFYLFDPEGNYVTERGGAAALHRLDERLSQTGAYTLLVLADYFSDSYDYLLTVTRVGCGTNLREPGDDPEPLVPGQVSHGQIALVDVDTYCFSASSNDVVAIGLGRTTGTGIPRFYLFDPEGNYVSEQGGGGSVYTQNQRLSQNGIYTLLVLADYFSDSYDYTLCIIKIPGPNVPEDTDGSEFLAPGELRSAAAAAGDVDAFAFYAIAGDSVEIIVDQAFDSGGFLVVEVYGPRGDIIQGAPSSTGLNYRLPCLADAGVYHVVVRDDDLLDASTYTVRFYQTPVVPPSGGLTQYLAILRCSTNIILRWETNSAGFMLESASRPASFASEPPNVWSPVTTPSYVIANHYYVNEGAVTQPAQFYRLRCTNCPTSLVEKSR